MERVQTGSKPNPSLSALNLSRDITSDTEVGKEWKCNVQGIRKESDTKTGGSIQIELDRNSILVPKYTTSVQSSDLTMNHGNGSKSNIEEVLNQSISVVL